MGHDPDCARWIRRFRDHAPAPRGEPRRRARPRAGAAKAVTAVDRLRRPERGYREPSPIRSSSSRRPASAGGLRSARRCSPRRGHSASTSTPSAAAARICGRCQVLRGGGRVREARRAVRRRQSVAVVRNPSSAIEPATARAPGAGSSCQARVEADVVIDVPPGSQVHRQVVRKSAEARDIELDPLVKLHYVEVTEPDMHDPSGDLQRLAGCARARMAARRPAMRPARAAAAAGGVARGRDGRSPSRCTTHRGSSPSGRASTTSRSDWRSTSARRRSRRTSAIWRAARSWPRPGA